MNARKKSRRPLKVRKTYTLDKIHVDKIEEISIKEKKDASEIVRDALDMFLLKV